MNKLTSLIVLLLAGMQLVYAQRTITGTVTAEGEGPLVGATIQVKGTSTGTTTDVDGTYSIQLPTDNATLVFSYIGYSTQEVPVNASNVINVVLSSGELLNEVIIVGTRAEGRTKLTTAVPVDVLNVEELVAAAPQTTLTQLLNYVAPSFSSNTQTISDGTDHLDPASLRGLGPDQVLVLINGKRRHTSSLVNINGTFGRGNVGTDLNAISPMAIKRIEILRDGAAAQYGSDAIAGVINIILKEEFNELTANLSVGAYASEGSNSFTGGLDGEAYDLSMNYGLPIGQQGGYINFTGSFESRDYTNRMESYTGLIFNAYNGVERLAREQNLDVSNLTDQQVRNLAQNLPYLSGDEKKIIADADATLLHTANAAVNPLFKDVSNDELAIRGLERPDFNMRIGQSALRGGKFFMNMAIPLSDNAEVYAFGGLANRDGLATGFFRYPNEARTYSPAYPNGFLPEIHTDINDQSLAAGIRGQLQGWNVDFSNTYGRNAFSYTVENSNNATMRNSTPFEFEAGGFSFMQNTTNFDVSRYWENVLAGFNFAFGAEYRVENYEIFAGNENSYASYDINGQIVTPNTPRELLVVDFFGRSRPGGAQVFPGFAPANELNKFRNSVAGYFDLEADITEAWLLSFATRFENYSDFGSTTNVKVASRYSITDNFSIRAAGSTGFRAPSLHQIYFNSTSTLFVDGVPFEVGTFSNTSRIARILGIPKLKEETSTSFSAGATALIPVANLSLTVDVYQIDIDDRVVLTGQFEPGNNAELQRLFAQANAERATFFANAIDTRSRGVDVVLSHNWLLSGNSRLHTNLAATFTKTEQVGDVKTSPQLEPLKSTYFDETSRIFLEEAVPRQKVNLSFNYTLGRFSAFLRNVYFGPVTEATNSPENQQEFEGKVVTDVSVGYELLNNLRLTIGSNNVFDIYPDENIVANQGLGQFLYSRRSQQFGFQGRYIFARLSFAL